MRRTLSAILIIASMLCGYVYADQKLQTGILLGYYSVSPLHLPTKGDVPDLLLDLEYPEGEIPTGYSSDFNDDGFKEFLVQSHSGLCGTGGCLYILLDGKSKQRIGDFFGSQILVLDQKINRFPIIQSYANLSANGGEFVTYVFDGVNYQIVSDVYVEEESLKKLSKEIKLFRRVKARN